jgi:hypothetical protein
VFTKGKPGISPGLDSCRIRLPEVDPETNHCGCEQKAEGYVESMLERGLVGRFALRRLQHRGIDLLANRGKG